MEGKGRMIIILFYIMVIFSSSIFILPLVAQIATGYVQPEDVSWGIDETGKLVVKVKESSEKLTEQLYKDGTPLGSYFPVFTIFAVIIGVFCILGGETVFKDDTKVMGIVIKVQLTIWFLCILINVFQLIFLHHPEYLMIEIVDKVLAKEAVDEYYKRFITFFFMPPLYLGVIDLIIYFIASIFGDIGS